MAEGARDGCGYGIYPALENLSPHPLLPPPMEIRECLHMFLRRVGGFNPKSAGTFEAALEVTLESTVTKDPVTKMFSRIRIGLFL